MLKFFTLIASLFFYSQSLFAQMVLKYQINSSNRKIALPLNGTVNATVDWGDGSTKKIFTSAGSQTHTYSVNGSFTVTISGTLSWFGSREIPLGPNLISVESWDGVGLTSLSYAFLTATSLISVPKNLPSSITDLSGMFYEATSFNHPINTWQTSNVTNMAGMFSFATAFNQPIDTWNTSSVSDMSAMFYEADSFNQPIGSWNTGNVKDMHWMFARTNSFNQFIGTWNTSSVTKMINMFYGAKAFNMPIDTWNTISVTDMTGMFFAAIAFNQPLGKWQTSKVNSMKEMFYFSTSFNQPIGNWNTENVYDMEQMFRDATSFNQPIGTWNIKNVIDMRYMFSGANLCTENYNNLLTGWATQNVQLNITFHSDSSKYSAESISARNTLISKGWKITDGGQGIDNTKCPLITGYKNLKGNTITQNLNIYPNPSVGIFTLSGYNLLETISIYNSIGTLVYEIKTNKMQQIIDFNSYEAGIYLVKIGNKSAKFIKE